MSILLFGATGQVGNFCIAEAQRLNLQLIPLTPEDCDLCQPELIAETIKQHKPNMVINAAAHTAVDLAEGEQEEIAYLVNAKAPEMMARACKDLGIPLIHISTDYVFDGTSKTPYTEDDTPNPINVYGKSKLLGEQVIAKELSNFLIFRTSWVFSQYNANFVKTMIKLADRPSLNVVSDQFGRPTYAGHIAEIIFQFVELIEAKKEFGWGIYNLSGSPSTTWHQFSEEIFRTFSDLNSIESIPEVSPIETKDYPTPAQRPKMSILDLSKIKSTIEIDNNWKQGLIQTIKSLE